jgi:hypothetical protein
VRPRPLSEIERESLLRLLPEGVFDGVDQYREQIQHATVVRRCECGCPTINLGVDRSIARGSPFVGTPLLPLEGEREKTTRPSY